MHLRVGQVFWPCYLPSKRLTADGSRLLAVELGKPLLNKDEDFATNYLGPTDDDRDTSDGLPTQLVAMVNVVRCLQSLSQPLQSLYITRERLQSYEEYLHTCFSSFPQTFHTSASEPLDPRVIGPLICLQNARLLLQRHNLTPSCPADLRLEAIDKCVMVARDTAMTLSRCLDPALSPKAASSEKPRLLAISASTVLCMHLWRCLLFLLFRADYAPAIILVQAASSIGGARPVNQCCGRHVEFFLHLLYSRLQKGHSGNFDEDEEMIAYVSGDLQSNPDTSWVWQERDRGWESSKLATSAPGLPPLGQGRSGSTPSVRSPAPTETEIPEWAGWEQVERSLQYLLERRPSARQASQWPPRRRSPVSPPSDASRMTIANII